MIEKEHLSELGRSSNQEDISNRKLDNKTNSFTLCDERFEPPHCDFVEGRNLKTTIVDEDIVRNIEQKYEYSSSESDDSDIELGGALKRTKMFQDLSLDNDQSLYQGFSFQSKYKSASREYSNDVCSKDKRVLAVEERDDIPSPPDVDDEISKKIESRLWFFNAVSKSNCCDCYKEGYESDNIKEEIISCPEYKRIKETEEYTDFIKSSIYTSLLKGNVRKNEEYLVDYLPKIDEIDEDEEMTNEIEEDDEMTNEIKEDVEIRKEKDESEGCTVDNLEENEKTSAVADVEDIVDGTSSETESSSAELKQRKKRFKGLRKFFARIFCCIKKQPEADI